MGKTTTTWLVFGCGAVVYGVGGLASAAPEDLAIETAEPPAMDSEDPLEPANDAGGTGTTGNTGNTPNAPSQQDQGRASNAPMTHDPEPSTSRDSIEPTVTEPEPPGPAGPAGPAVSAEDTTPVGDDGKTRKFNLNLTPGVLESFSPVGGLTHFGFYVSVNTDFLIPINKETMTTLIVSPGFEVGELGRDGLQWGPVFGLIIDQVVAERPKLTITVEPQVGYFLNAISLFETGGVDSVSHNLYVGLGSALILPSGLTFIPTITTSIAHDFSAASLALNPTFLVSIPIL